MARLAPLITGPGPHGSHSKSSSGCDGGLPQASPELLNIASIGFTERAEGPHSGCWYFAEVIEVTNHLGHRAFRMRTASYKTVNVQQQ